jgi:hypothetical protein
MRIFTRNVLKRNVEIVSCSAYRYINVPLLPRIKQSPYLACNCPVAEYSSVCSMAIFKYPSKLPNTPRYSIPEFNFTRIGRPNIDFKKSDGVFDFFGGAVVPLISLAMVVVVIASVPIGSVVVLVTVFDIDDTSLVVVDMMALSNYVKGSNKLFTGTIDLLLLHTAHHDPSGDNLNSSDV